MKVNEIFYSIQGEGHFTGTPAVFVRLSGCNRACPFCDTDFSHYREMSEHEIIANIAAYPAKHIVLTGGEPALQLTEEFVVRLKGMGYYVQIETNGSLPVPSGIDWVTCSPKEPPYRIQRVDELKVVYQGQDVEALAAHFSARVKALQPCSGANIAETVQYVLDHPGWRLSLQTHKLIDIK